MSIGNLDIRATFIFSVLVERRSRMSLRHKYSRSTCTIAINALRMQIAKRAEEEGVSIGGKGNNQPVRISPWQAMNASCKPSRSRPRPRQNYFGGCTLVYHPPEISIAHAAWFFAVVAVVVVVIVVVNEDGENIDRYFRTYCDRPISLPSSRSPLREVRDSNRGGQSCSPYERDRIERSHWHYRDISVNTKPRNLDRSPRSIIQRLLSSRWEIIVVHLEIKLKRLLS